MSDGGKAFLDTNVLLYMYGGPDERKTRQSLDLFHRCGREAAIVLSTQVIQEFYAAGSRKGVLPRRELARCVGEFLKLPLITLGPGEIRSALHLEDRYGISFWDALIVAAAITAGAEVLYTEDLNDGQQFGPVTVRNPFRTA